MIKNQLQTFKKSIKFKKTRNYYKNAVISGGTGRIGSVFVNELLLQNYKVIILSRSQKKFDMQIKYLPTKLKKKVFWNYFDLFDQNSFEGVIEKINKIFTNRVNCLINCASESKRGQLIDYNQKNTSLEMNGVFNSSFLLTEIILRYMRKAKNGKIINIGSLWGLLAPNYDTYLNLDIGPSSITAAGKSALMAYTKVIASRDAKHNITANNLVPGWFPRKGKKNNQKYINSICKQIPSGRIGKLEDLNSAIRFLIDEKNKYFNGQDLIVDGGYSIR